MCTTNTNTNTNTTATTNSNNNTIFDWGNCCIKADGTKYYNKNTL